MDLWGVFIMGMVGLILGVVAVYEYNRFMDGPAKSKAYDNSPTVYRGTSDGFVGFLYSLRRIFKRKKHHRHGSHGHGSKTSSRR